MKCNCKAFLLFAGFVLVLCAQATESVVGTIDTIVRQYRHKRFSFGMTK